MMMHNEESMRNAFGEALLDLALEIPEMVVLDADVSSSTQTIHFGKKYPHRFFNVGVAEANMVDIAGGMATCGLRPVASTFAIFMALKATDQIRNNICYNNLPVVMVGGYSGLSDSFDGASHQSITDIAIMQAMPNLKVIVPADATEITHALRYALKEKGPVYIRASRNPSPVIFNDIDTLNFGKINKLTEGADITIAVCGIPAYMALEASESLKQQGVRAEVLNISTVKPIDEETLFNSVLKTRKILVVEEHSIIGGLGCAVARVLAGKLDFKIEYIGIHDTFTQTGPYNELLETYGISTSNIISKVHKMIMT